MHRSKQKEALLEMEREMMIGYEVMFGKQFPQCPQIAQHVAVEFLNAHLVHGATSGQVDGAYQRDEVVQEEAHLATS